MLGFNLTACRRRMARFRCCRVTLDWKIVVLASQPANTLLQVLSCVIEPLCRLLVDRSERQDVVDAHHAQ